MFDQRSRYFNVETYETTDVRGNRVRAVSVPDAPRDPPIGRHILREGERLDLLANLYVDDPTAFWRIAELNGAMLPDALAEVEFLKIPPKGRTFSR